MVDAVQNTSYRDPLNKKLFVLMSYSNETGTLISEIAPRLGTALWAPTFMYLGADIYDKYKNDKDSYNPSAKRAFKRAIYQGITTLLALPTVIFIGQKLASPLTKMDKFGISGNAKDSIFKHTRNVIDQAHGDALESSDKFENLVVKSLDNIINARQNEKQTLSFFKRIQKSLFTSRYNLLECDKKKVLAFAKHNAQKTFEILTALKNNQTNLLPKKVYKKYVEVLPVMKEMYNEVDYSHHATRAALKEFQKTQIFKNKLIKTISGITTLVVFAIPVNNFVEKHIMKKFINPGIDQIAKELVDSSKIKQTFNTMQNTAE